MKPLRVATDFFCEICDVYTSSQLTLDTHFDGSKHQSAIKKLNEGKEIWPKRVEANYHCELCDVFTTSRRMLQIHLNGNKHKNVEKRCEEEQKLLNKLRSSDRQHPYTGIIERDGSFRCEVCQCDCTSISNVKTHIFGQRHQSNLEPAPDSNIEMTKLEKELANIKQPVVGLDFVLEYYNTKAPELPRFYHCTLCNLKFRESQIIAHILGQDHRLSVTKENRLEKYEELMLKVYSEGTTAAVEEWAEVLEHNYGRGRPTLMTLRPNRSQEPLDTLVIDDSDNEDLTRASDVGTPFRASIVGTPFRGRASIVGTPFRDRASIVGTPAGGSQRSDQLEWMGLKQEIISSKEDLGKTKSVSQVANFEAPSPLLTNFLADDKRDTANLPRNSQELCRNTDRPQTRPIKQEPRSPPSMSIHDDDALNSLQLLAKSYHGVDEDATTIREKLRTPRIKKEPRALPDYDDLNPLLAKSIHDDDEEVTIIGETLPTPRIKKEPRALPDDYLNPLQLLAKSYNGDDEEVTTIGERLQTPRIKKEPRALPDYDDQNPMHLRATRIKLEFPKLPDSVNNSNQMTLCSDSTSTDQLNSPISVVMRRAVTNPEAPRDPSYPQPGPSSQPVLPTSPMVPAPQPPNSQQYPWPPQYTMTSQQYWQQYYYSWAMMTGYQYPPS